jgi:hypothetical protein
MVPVDMALHHLLPQWVVVALMATELHLHQLEVAAAAL